MRLLISSLLLILFYAETASAQFYENRYRPPNQNWQELRTDHFRILFPKENRRTAFRSARILEREYPSIQNLVGGELSGFPVILNMENDRSNGFVSPINFRTEIEGAPSRSKTLSPRGGEWLEQVLPHELVHALHFSVRTSGPSALVGLFSPDLRRSIHAAAPMGVFEGIAVHYESHSTPYNAGRGNHSYFSERYRSIMNSAESWSFGQHLHPSGTVLPFDRHYLGSYHFTDWLLKTYGQESMKEAIEFHHRWPLLGFGFALRYVTRYWPSSLFREFKRTVSEDGPIDSPDTLPALTDREGVTVRRPIWLGDHTLLFHGSFYDAPTGFYRYDLRNNRLDLELEQRITDDLLYRYDSELEELIYAAYRVKGRYDNVFHSDLHRYRPGQQRPERLTRGKRLYSPSGHSPLHAIQIQETGSRLVSVHPESGITRSLGGIPAHLFFQEISHHPVHHSMAAVIARSDGKSGIWISEEQNLAETLNNPPDLYLKNASIHDLQWHPRERRLLFSSDPDGTLDLYEYEPDSDEILRLTRSPVNRFEGSWSPDGSRIAYVFHRDNRTLPAVLERSRVEPERINASPWPGNSSKSDLSSEIPSGFAVDPEEYDWEVTPWRTGLSWVTPRSAIPSFRRHESGSYQTGLIFTSTDLLGRHTYRLHAFHIEKRGWFDLDYRYTGFWPGTGLNLYQRPVSLRWVEMESGETIRTLARDRGGSFYIPFRYTFRRDRRLSEVRFRPSVGYRSRDELQPERINGLNHYRNNRMSARFPLTLSYRVRQYLRDAQPNTGWILFMSSDLPLSEHTYSEGSRTVIHRKKRGLYGGLYRYLPVVPRSNITLRLGGRHLIQTAGGPFDMTSLVSPAFSDIPFASGKSIGLFDTRMTVPLLHPEEGGVLVPAYLGRIYLVLFSETVTDLQERTAFEQSRTVFGAGIRARVRLSNLHLDLGIAVGIEPTRGNWRVLAGEF